MIKALYVIGGIFALLFLVDRFTRAKVERLRAQGVYPPPGQGSEADVERLMLMGHKIEAIKVYREIHGVGLKDAKEAVEKLAERLARERPQP